MANPLRRLASRIVNWWRVRSVHPDVRMLVHAKWYAGHNPDVPERYALLHYLDHGAAEGRDPNPLFDTRWYLAEYPDVAASGINPLVQYVSSGASEGRNPHPLFDTRWYRARHMGGVNANPLLHFLTAGSTELQPHPLFDSAWYAKQYPEVARSGMIPLLHFVTAGLAARYGPNPLFDTDWYLTQYPDVARTTIDPITHYLRFGAPEGRDPGLDFDTNWYRTENELKDDVNPLVHYVTVGRDAGRSPLPYSAHRRNDAMRVVSAGLAQLVALEPSLSEAVSRSGVRHLSSFSGLVSGRRYKAWRNLFHSLSRAYDAMIFVPSLQSSYIALAGKLRDATVGREANACLLVATDEAALAPSSDVLKAFDARDLSQIEPNLTPDDRMAIVRLLIFHLQPSAALNAGSVAWWGAVERSGAALSINTRLSADIGAPNALTATDGARGEIQSLGSCLPHLTTLFVENRDAERHLVNQYGLSDDARGKFAVLTPLADHVDAAALQEGNR